MTSANEHQVAGDHYKAALQHWDWVQALMLPYFPANATKYLVRWRKKNGVQDLEKARHYIVKYIEEIEKLRDRADDITDKFLEENKVTGRESFIMRSLARANTPNINILKNALDYVDMIIDEAKSINAYSEAVTA